MIYRNAVKYVQSAPGSSEAPPSAERMRLLLRCLGNPQKNLKYIRLAGSNGKTVCLGLLNSVLKEANINVGCLNMPPKIEIKDNIIINSKSISMDECAEYASRVSNAVKQLNAEMTTLSNENPESPFNEFIPSSAEILIAMALLAFKENKCALCIIESDHSRPDPSRFLPPPFAAVICGTIPSNDKKEISKIRSYICRGIQEIVSAPQNNEAYHIISDTCVSVNCRLTLPSKSEISINKLSFYGTDFSYKGLSYSLRLCGRFEINNALVALETLDMLSRRGYAISLEQIRKGFAKLSIPTKFEILSSTPFIIADSTHDPIAIETVCESMEDFKDITGTRIRLCLPEGDIIQNYIEVLQRKKYTIESIITLSADGSNTDSYINEIPQKAMKNTKLVAKTALKDLGKDTLLLISGPFSFTSEVRYEILAIMDF